MGEIWTIGHSNRDLTAFSEMLADQRIELLADVRAYPRSRHNPQFNIDTLPACLAERGIAYRHLRDLGGHRTPRPDSANLALPSGTFRGYADYMETPAFAQAIGSLIGFSREWRVAIMCAEADPMGCHRSLISDYLSAGGCEITHILGANKTSRHALRSECLIENGRVSYCHSNRQLQLF